VKTTHDKVNSLLSTLELDTTLDGLLPHTNILYVIRYQSRQGSEGKEPSFLKGEEEKKGERRREEEEVHPVIPAPRAGQTGHYPRHSARPPARETGS
jgi:hypothetical protein